MLRLIKDIDIKFMAIRRIPMFLSSALVVICLTSIILKGFNFGIDLGVSDVSSFSHNNIMEYILKSRNVIENTLMQQVTINNKKDLLIEHYLDVNKITEDWNDGEGFSGVSFHEPNTYQHDSIMN